MKMRSVLPALLALIACTSSPDSTAEANKDIVREFVATYNSGDFDHLDQLMTADLARHSQAAGVEVRTLDELKDHFGQMTAAFPDAREEIHVIVAEEDKVALYGTWTATQEGSYGPFPATGKTASIKFFYLFRVEGGKIAEFWTEWDNLSMLTQFGHFPPSPERKGDSST